MLCFQSPVVGQGLEQLPSERRIESDPKLVQFVEIEYMQGGAIAFNAAAEIGCESLKIEQSIYLHVIAADPVIIGSKIYAVVRFNLYLT